MIQQLQPAEDRNNKGFKEAGNKKQPLHREKHGDWSACHALLTDLQEKQFPSS